MKRSARKPLTARDRALRLEAYKLHILCLLANASYRNRWCCDDLLKVNSVFLEWLEAPTHSDTNFTVPLAIVGTTRFTCRFSHTAISLPRCYATS
jgi:hypothetical protein